VDELEPSGTSFIRHLKQNAPIALLHLDPCLIDRFDRLPAGFRWLAAHGGSLRARARRALRRREDRS
jgi:hypothetical protein